jgi:hypothetical protein
VDCGGNLQGSGGVPTRAIQQHQAMLVGKAGGSVRQEQFMTWVSLETHASAKHCEAGRRGIVGCGCDGNSSDASHIEIARY